MFFISMACMDEDANKTLKIILSIFPPVCLELGVVLIGKFQSHFKDLHLEDYTKTYTNYSVFIMNYLFKLLNGVIASSQKVVIHQYQFVSTIASDFCNVHVPCNITLFLWNDTPRAFSYTAPC